MKFSKTLSNVKLIYLEEFSIEVLIYSVVPPVRKAETGLRIVEKDMAASINILLQLLTKLFITVLIASFLVSF